MGIMMSTALLFIIQSFAFHLLLNSNFSCFGFCFCGAARPTRNVQSTDCFLLCITIKLTVQTWWAPGDELTKNEPDTVRRLTVFVPVDQERDEVGERRMSQSLRLDNFSKPKERLQIDGGIPILLCLWLFRG